MKSLSYICIIILALASACSDDVSNDEISTDLISNPITASGEDNEDQKAIITFETKEYDFGRIIQGEKISFSFSFTNDGNAPLIISSVASTCGCTIPKWSKEPIEKGEGGEIAVLFDSDGKEGALVKDITVITNAVPNTVVLRLSGEIIVP